MQHREVQRVEDLGPFVIKVEMWYTPEDGGLAYEFCGEFLWGIEFEKGPTLIFDHPGEALMVISQHSQVSGVDGFEYRYRVCRDTSGKLALPF